MKKSEIERMLPEPYTRGYVGVPRAKGIYRKLKTLVANLRLLMRYSLKDVNSYAYVDMSDYVYEIKDIEDRAKVPKVHDPISTIKMLANSNRSFIRIGDGEIKILEGEDIPFQKATPSLSERLGQVVKSKESAIDLGFSWVYFHPDTVMQRYLRQYNWGYVRSHRHILLKYVDVNREYYDAGISQLYQMFNDSFDFTSYFDLVKSIWDNRDVLLVCGDKSMDGFEYDVFENARTVEKLCGPTVNAWDQYEDLLQKAKHMAGTKLVIVILGPAGKVLSYDLALLGIRALDMGHMAKDYNAYMTRAPKDWNGIRKFFSPE